MFDNIVEYLYVSMLLTDVERILMNIRFSEVEYADDFSVDKAVNVRKDNGRGVKRLFQPSGINKHNRNKYKACVRDAFR